MRVEWVSRRLDLDIPLPFDRFCYVDQAVACRRVGEAPTAPILTQEVAIGDPASGFVRVTTFAPSVDSSPYKVIDFGKRLSTDDVPMIVCPTSEHRVELVDERIRRSAFMAFANGSDLLLDALETGLAGRDLQFCRFPVRPGMFPQRLS